MLKNFFLAAAVALIAVSNVCHAKTYKLYFLGGQSNMDGYGKVAELPKDLTKKLANVRIFHGSPAPDGTAENGKGVWSVLQPGHGRGFSSDGTTNNYSDCFGIELTFVRELLKKHPDANIALIKYSRGGTSIHIKAARNFGCWDPDFSGGEGKGKGINQYDHFLATLRNAAKTQDIDGDGEADELIPTGILWMQGESDAALTKEVAMAYEANLRRLMDLIRAAMRQDDLPVVIGRISDSGKDAKDGKVWDYGNIVRQAQADFVKKDGHAALVTSTDNYKYSDPWHYDTAGYIDLGQQFANAILKLENR